MNRQELSMMTDKELISLAKQVKKEREHRQQVCLSQYRSELAQMWSAIVTKVKELDEMDVSVSVRVEKKERDLTFSLTDLLKEEDFIVSCYTTAVSKSES